MGGGHWHTTPIFEEVGVSVENHMSFSVWKLLPEEDRAYMVAYGRVKSTMTAWEHHLASESSKKKN